MRSFRYTQHIDRPCEQVFAYMMDFSNAPRWRNLVRRMEVVGGGPVKVGSKILVTLDIMGRSMQIESEVWCYEPPHRVGQRNTRNGVTGVFEYVLEPDGMGTNVAYSCDIRPHATMWLALPWLIASNRYRYRGQLPALKRAIEQKA